MRGILAISLSCIGNDPNPIGRIGDIAGDGFFGGISSAALLQFLVCKMAAIIPGSRSKLS